MSVRVYTGPHAVRRSGPSRGAASVPWVLAAVTILAQIAWPLTSGSARASLTVGIVLLFVATSAAHAWVHRGFLWMLGWLVGSVAVGFAAEVVGTRTGLPFGTYAYAQDVLGPSLLGVPVVISLAWAMMSYPALLVGRRLAAGRVAVVGVAAFALASWDLFLDPQMVGEGYWTWASPDPSLPGLPGIPVQNYLGWFAVALVLMALLDLLPRRRGAAEGVPAVMYGWTWVGGVVANLFFLDRPWVALWGGLAMGVVAVPYLWNVWVNRP